MIPDPLYDYEKKDEGGDSNGADGGLVVKLISGPWEPWAGFMIRIPFVEPHDTVIPIWD